MAKRKCTKSITSRPTAVVLSFARFRGRAVYEVPDIFYDPKTLKRARYAREHRAREAADN